MYIPFYFTTNPFTDIGIVLTAWRRVYSSKLAPDEGQHLQSDNQLIHLNH